MEYYYFKNSQHSAAFKVIDDKRVLRVHLWGLTKKGRSVYDCSPSIGYIGKASFDSTYNTFNKMDNRSRSNKITKEEFEYYFNGVVAQLKNDQ